MKKYNFFLQLFNVFLSLLVLYIANLIVIRDFDDNEAYNLAFQSIGDLGIKEAYFVFSKIIGGGVEPVYFLLNYIFNNYLNFNILIMLINTIFLYFIHRALRTFYPKNYLVIYTVLILSSNFIFVLLADLHRLKLAIVFFLAYLTSVNYRGVLLSISLATHFQMTAYIIYRAFDHLLNKFSRHNKTYFNKRYMAIFILGVGAFIFIFYDALNLYVYLPLENKIKYYTRPIESYFNMVWYGGLFGIYFTYLILFKLRETGRLLIPLFITLFTLSIILNLYRLNLIWLTIVFIVEFNRFLTGKNYAIIIATPLFMYTLYGFTRFSLRGFGLLEY